MNNKGLVAVWPRDFLLPKIDHEITQLLRYLTRDDSWRNCFNVQVVVDAIVVKLKKGRFWKGIFQRHPEITDEYVAQLVAEVCLNRGLAILHKGTQMVITENKDIKMDVHEK